jgi:hypothetical protein
VSTKKTFVSLASSKHVEDATSEHCNKDITKKGDATNIITTHAIAVTIAIAKK